MKRLGEQRNCPEPEEAIQNNTSADTPAGSSFFSSYSYSFSYSYSASFTFSRNEASVSLHIQVSTDHSANDNAHFFII